MEYTRNAICSHCFNSFETILMKRTKRNPSAAPYTIRPPFSAIVNAQCERIAKILTISFYDVHNNWAPIPCYSMRCDVMPCHAMWLPRTEQKGILNLTYCRCLETRITASTQMLIETEKATRKCWWKFRFCNKQIKMESASETTHWKECFILWFVYVNTFWKTWQNMLKADFAISSLSFVSTMKYVRIRSFALAVCWFKIKSINYLNWTNF